jgi:hypothetical protein
LNFMLPGRLTIEGLNLKNAAIKVATFDKCMILEDVKHIQVNLTTCILFRTFCPKELDTLNSEACSMKVVFINTLNNLWILKNSASTNNEFIHRL